MNYSLSDDTWDNDELKAINRVIESKHFTMGKEVEMFEKEFAQYFNSKYAVMVNSGSSANLLAIAALIYSGRLSSGDEVIVPSVSWSTTYSPLAQYNLKVKFVDIDIDTLNLDLSVLEGAIGKNTKAIFAVNLLGNSNDYNELSRICNENNLILIEDNCESMGATFNNKFCGTFGLLGTFSMFYSHHICTMEGGVVVTDDIELYHYMLSIRAHGWTRNIPNDSDIYQKEKDDFYESFNFIVPGYNLRPLEMEAAIGLVQLGKLTTIVNNRRKNADVFRREVSNNSVILQKEIGASSWFGFSIVARVPDERFITLRNSLRESGYECRPIVAGNFCRNKVIDYFDYEIYSNLDSSNVIHDYGLFVGNHSQLVDSEVFKNLNDLINKIY